MVDFIVYFKAKYMYEGRSYNFRGHGRSVGKDGEGTNLRELIGL